MGKMKAGPMYVCKKCDYSGKKRGYGAFSFRPEATHKCPDCGSTQVKREDKHHRFLRVGTERLRILLKELDKRIDPLASPNYVYEEAEVKRFIRLLVQHIKKKESLFQCSRNGAGGEVTL